MYERFNIQIHSLAKLYIVSHKYLCCWLHLLPPLGSLCPILSRLSVTLPFTNIILQFSKAFYIIRSNSTFFNNFSLNSGDSRKIGVQIYLAGNCMICYLRNKFISLNSMTFKRCCLLNSQIIQCTILHFHSVMGYERPFCFPFNCKFFLASIKGKSSQIHFCFTRKTSTILRSVF